MTTAQDDTLLSDDAWRKLGAELGLSNRELEVARAVMRDEKELAIAFHLGISAHTVHTHLERMYRKLGVSSRLQLVVELFRHHMASQERAAETPAAATPDEAVASR